MPCMTTRMEQARNGLIKESTRNSPLFVGMIVVLSALLAMLPLGGLTVAINAVTGWDLPLWIPAIPSGLFGLSYLAVKDVEL